MKNKRKALGNAIKKKYYKINGQKLLDLIKRARLLGAKKRKKKKNLKSCNGMKVVLWVRLLEPLLYVSPPGLPHNKLQKDIKRTQSSSCHINEQAFKQVYLIILHVSLSLTLLN